MHRSSRVSPKPRIVSSVQHSKHSILSWALVVRECASMKRFRTRRGIGMLEGYRYLAPRPPGESGRKALTGYKGRAQPKFGPTCEACHYWHPCEFFPSVGQCANPTSRHYERTAFHDKPTEGCFVLRSLSGLEFVWCQDHRETVHTSGLSAHGGCGLFVSSARLPVEEEMEFTFAAD